MLVMFSVIFVVDTKIIFGSNFRAPLIILVEAESEFNYKISVDYLI